MKILILVITGLILFVGLAGLRGLCEPDEGRYAEISREMVEGGDWFVPRLNYIKHLHKPPLVYWVTAVSFSCFGENEFTARLPVALIGILGLIITYLLAVKITGSKKTGLFSGLILATIMQYFTWTQVLSSDLVFSFFILLAIYGFWNRNYLFYIGMALAFMVKGPVAVIVPILIIVIYLLFTREWSFFKKNQVIKGILLFLLIVSPWFIYICINNPGLAKYFILHQSLERLFSETHGRGGNPLYFVPIVLLGGLPWIVFLPWAVKVKDKTNTFLLIWLIVPVIFFSFSRSKLPGYILPIYPAMAIIIGSYIEKRMCYKLFYIVFTSACSIYLVAVGLLPMHEEDLGNNLSIRKPAGIILEYGFSEDMIINYRCFMQGLPFYLRKRIILVEKDRETQFEGNKDVLKEFVISDGDAFFDAIEDDQVVWCFTKEKDYEDLKNDSPFEWYPVWNKSEYVLLCNKEVNI